MSRIAIVHPDLNKQGGAEAVCLNIANALATHHEVDLISLTKPRTAELESYYQIPCQVNAVHTSGPLGPIIERITTGMSNVADVGNLGVLDVALVNRIAKKKTQSYDLVVSSMSEMCFEMPSVQYIHYPNFHRSEIEQEQPLYNRVYERLNQIISGTGAIPHQSHTYLANSQWTADQFQRIYGKCPDIVYPPVDTREFNPLPWDQRKNGILMVGRIAPDKRILRTIETFVGVHQDGYDGQLRIIGPIHDKEYGKRVQQRVKSYDFVHFDGKLHRPELVTAMSEYKYAIHGKENEHFGMVVAEFVAAGMIPFVPNSGGQTEIVGENKLLVYETWSELKDKLLSVTADRETQLRLQEQMSDVPSRFGQERFRESIRNLVSEKLTEV